MKIKYLSYFCVFILLLFSCSSQKKTAVIQEPISQEIEAVPEVKITEYILGCGDELEISLFGHEEMTKKMQILPDGKIYYPLVGEIKAAGLSINELKEKIRKKLLKYYLDPKVSVIVTAVKSRKVFVLGEVNKPGVYLLETLKTVTQIISEAGGLTENAKQQNVILIRRYSPDSKPTYKILNIEAALKGNLKHDLVLQKGDVIYVPASKIARVDRFFEHLWTIIPARLALIGVRF